MLQINNIIFVLRELDGSMQTEINTKHRIKRACPHVGQTQAAQDVKGSRHRMIRECFLEEVDFEGNL